MVQFLNAREAVNLIKDGDTLASCAFVTNLMAESLLRALGARFVASGSPRNLTLVHASGIGTGDERGLNYLAHEGLLKRVIAGHWNMTRKIGRLAADEKLEAYNLPQGVITHLYRDIAAGKIGTLTHVGLLTFVDPRLDGGRVNKSATEDLVKLVNIDGQERLLYKAFPITACFLRGTYADERGNISLEHEGLTLEVLAVAQAVRNSGGTVMFQVDEVVKAGSLDPRLVKVPGMLVDVVVVPEPAELAIAKEQHNPSFTGEIRVPVSSLAPIAMSERKIIARRAAMELIPGSIINLGIGMPEAVAAVATEEGTADAVNMVIESGAVGGVPQGGRYFGLAVNPDAIMNQDAQFDFFDGGGLDMAFLGLAEADAEGNINVSKLGARLTGAGGFINITQNAKKVFYCGTFTAKGLEVEARDGQLYIVREGSQKKFVNAVGHVTFSGNYARQVGQPVRYITERAVFELRTNGMHLIEVAPGVDIKRDILAHMDFVPHMDTPPKLMDARIFTDAPMRVSGKG